jgi:hypothetical protein
MQGPGVPSALFGDVGDGYERYEADSEFVHTRDVPGVECDETDVARDEGTEAGRPPSAPLPKRSATARSPRRRRTTSSQ